MKMVSHYETSAGLDGGGAKLLFGEKVNDETI